MIGQAGQWTQTPFTTPFQPIKWNAHILDYVQLLMISRAGQWNQTPSVSFLQPKKMKCYFLDYVQLLMISWTCQWTWTPSTTCLQPKRWNAHILIMFTLDDWPGWSKDSNPIHHPSPPNKMKCSYFDYVQLLMISLAGQWTQNPSTTPLQPIKWNASFWIVFTSDDQPGWLMDSNPICHPSPANKMKCLFLYYVQLLMLDRLVNELKPHPPPLSSQ